MAFTKGYLFEENQLQGVVDSLNSHWKLPVKDGESKFELDIFSPYNNTQYFLNESKEWYQPVLGVAYNVEFKD